MTANEYMKKIKDNLDSVEQNLEQIQCDDCISRQAVLDIFGKIDTYTIFCENAKRIIKALPSVTPQPKIGQWIVDGSVDCYLDKVRCHCSECGKKKEFPADYDHIKHKLSISYQYPEFIDNYCPNCGCRMVDPQESEG